MGVGGFVELERSFDPDNVVRGRVQFEPLIQWWLGTDPEYRSLLRRVWRWDEWPGRDGPDYGIDLVGEAYDGGVWAIQVKCLRADRQVRKAEIDSFFAVSGKAPFTFRLLVTSSEAVSANLRRTFSNQAAAYVTRDRLLTSPVSWPVSVNDLTSGAQLPAKAPREHQAEAIGAVAEGFRTSDRGQLIMACGTGKTLTALFATERLVAARTLVLVPSLSLLSQTLLEWTANTSRRFVSLAVCSDETVGSHDDAVSHTADLGIPVTTGPETIARFLHGDEPLVVFATYQSSMRIADAYASGGVPMFDLVVADEAHRCVGPASSQFATVLDNDLIPACRRLFMTATPRYFTGRAIREAGDADFEVASMSDEAVFGPVMHRLNFSEAIRRDLLSDYQIAVVVVDDPTYRDWADDRIFVTSDGIEITDAGTLAGQIGLAKAIKKYGLRRVISFHSRVRNAVHFATTLPDVIDWMPTGTRPDGKLWSTHISGEMPAGRRRVLLTQLRDLHEADRGVITNARCLSEGVDVPSLDGVAFIDPKRSTIDIIQAVGRAIRKAPDKTIGTIVIPVFIGPETDPETALDSSAFKPVWDVVTALRDQDDSLAEELDELRRKLGRGSTDIRLPARFHLDLPVGITSAFAAAFDARLVHQSTTSFEQGIGHLQAYMARTGHATVPYAIVDETGFPLGTWANSRRLEHNAGRLSADRVTRLEGFSGWSWDPRQDWFDEGIAELQRYVQEHGTAWVPYVFSTDDGYPLGSWVNSRRIDYRVGQLRPQRRAALEAFPGWTWDAFGDQFSEGVSYLQTFADREGHARVPGGYTETDFPLGRWVTKRRSDRRAGRMSPDRVALLEAIPGWTWDPLVDQFEEGIDHLRRFVERTGSANPRRAFVDEDGFLLGAWANKRRHAYRKGRLPADQAPRLEAFPGWAWEPRVDQFEEGFQLLQQYVERNGNARVPRSQTDGYPLGRWIGKLRDKHNAGLLTAERIARLEQLPGWSWDPHSDRFDEGVEQLARYVAREGHARVPHGYLEGGFPLGSWVLSRRRDKRADKLAPERIARLEQMPGWTWDAQADRVYRRGPT